MRGAIERGVAGWQKKDALAVPWTKRLGVPGRWARHCEMASAKLGFTSHSSDRSDSSSVVYQHEPFTIFCSRILDLAASNWPDSDVNGFCAERLSGGGFFASSASHDRTSAGETRYIVRIPRFDSAKVDGEVAVLHFVGRIAIPVPTVITFDKTAGLNHGQKASIARELSAIFRQMLEIRSSTGGRLVLDSEKGAVRIAPLSQPSQPPTQPDDSTPSEPPPTNGSRPSV